MHRERSYGCLKYACLVREIEVVQTGVLRKSANKQVGILEEQIGTVRVVNCHIPLAVVVGVTNRDVAYGLGEITGRGSSPGREVNLANHAGLEVIISHKIDVPRSSGCACPVAWCQVALESNHQLRLVITLDMAECYVADGCCLAAGIDGCSQVSIAQRAFFIEVDIRSISALNYNGTYTVELIADLYALIGFEGERFAI